MNLAGYLREDGGSWLRKPLSATVSIQHHRPGRTQPRWVRSDCACSLIVPPLHSHLEILTPSAGVEADVVLLGGHWFTKESPLEWDGAFLTGCQGSQLARCVPPDAHKSPEKGSPQKPATLGPEPGPLVSGL